MAENEQQIGEKLLSNNILKDVFQELHDTVVNNINASSVIGKLFSAKVISTNDMQELHFIKNPHEKCTRLMIILHKAKKPRTFIELRTAITTEESYEWLVKTVDKKYNLLTSLAAHSQVIRVSYSPSLTPLNGDVTELNRVIDDLRRENAELRTEISRLLKEQPNQKLGNERVSKDNVTLTTENNRLLEDIKRLTDDNERLCLERSTNDEKMANIVDKLKKELESVRLSQNNPQLLVTLEQPPTDRDGVPLAVNGLVMLEKYLYVLYCNYKQVEVFDCEDRFQKINQIKVKAMTTPNDMVGSSETSQLFISEWSSEFIRRVDLKTGFSDWFVKTGYENTRLSLVDNRLLVRSRDSMLIFDIVSGERIKKIPLTNIEKFYIHAIESNRDLFFVCHGTSGNNTVSEIDSEGRVIRVFDNKQQPNCVHLALNSVGRLLATDFMHSQVVLFDEHLKYEKILIDNKRLDNAGPTRLSYNKNNNRLMVGLKNGQVKIFVY